MAHRVLYLPLSDNEPTKRGDAHQATDDQKPQAPGEEAMLVLTRKRDEIIKIGNDIVIKVIKTGNGSVKIGVDAPAHVRVLRGEVATVEMEVNEFELHDQVSSLLEECTLDAVLVQN